MNDSKKLAPRPVSESQSEMSQIVLPNDVNPLGSLLGGTLMHWIDLAAAMAAHRHSRCHTVTASIDHLDFLWPARIENVVILRSSVNRAFHTSMEIGVKVWAEDFIAGARHHVASAYLSFVAVDRNFKRLPVPPVIPETDEQKRRYEEAGRRRELRIQELARKADAQKMPLGSK
jgi:acyl-CoA hydrolase